MKDLPEGLRVRGGRLYFYYQHNGKRRFVSTGLAVTPAHIAQAVKLRKQQIEAAKYGIEPDDPQEQFKTGTFAAVAQDYLDALEVKASTRASYKQLLQAYWMPHLQHRQVAAIELPLLRKIVRETEWTSRKVRKNACSVLRQALEFAKDEGYRDDNPAMKLTIARKKSEQIDPDPYTPAERDSLLAWLQANSSPEIYAYFLTAFYTGMRTGELIALTWQDYDGTSLAVSKARVRGEITTTKTDEARTVLIPEKVQKALNGLPSRFKRGVLFANQYGRHYQAGYHLNKAFRKAHDATKVRHRDGPYPWRHTYASIGLTNGNNPAWLAKQLGHSKQMFFSVYSKWIEGGEQDKLELEKII